MDDCSEFVLKKLCCTCLSRDRKLSQLCRLKEGINNLYLLLSHDTEAYREGFYKDTASWHICWECWAIMNRISRFRSQACTAQRQLTDIVEGRKDLKLLNSCLSHLTATHKSDLDFNFTEKDCIQQLPSDNFIDCGADIKTESDEDIPLSLLHNTADDITHSDEDAQIKKDQSKPHLKKRLKKTSGCYKKKKLKAANKNELTKCEYKDYFTTTLINDDLNESKSKQQLAVFANSLFKCKSCIEGFNTKKQFDEHVFELHDKKEKYEQCDKCLVNINKCMISDHIDEHLAKHMCKLCEFTAHSLCDILYHMKSTHSIQTLEHTVERKKIEKRAPKILKPGSKPRRNRPMMDKRTPFGYLCTECNKYFDNKNQRWKHIQSQHREGYKCATCDKRFTFKNNLSRHELIHKAPPSRQECPDCHKMVRVDLMKIHARIHMQRDRYKCAECDKSFVSRASYENHLRYTQVHSATDVLKYKCAMCDKGYRSRGELRDHINYIHMEKTQHKCPVCGKALATRRCITRHIKRVHDGVKERPLDKICQQCGKAFRDKKGLREHEFIHTGERPLSCEICGCTFRQSASLYTHKKRVHKIFPSKKNVTLLETNAT